MYEGRVLPFYGSLKKVLRRLSVIDMVIVDGPPRHWGRKAAMYAVFPYLKIGGYIFLDDAKRLDERLIVEEWKRVFGDAARYIFIDEIGRGLAIIQKTASTRSRSGFTLTERYRESLHTVKTFRRRGRYTREWR